LRLFPFVLLVVGFFVYTKTVLDFSDAGQIFVERGSILDYPLTQLRAHGVYYLRNFVWPFYMRPLPMISIASLANVGVWFGGLVVVASLMIVLRVWKTFPVLSFSILAYWAMFSPTSSVLPFRMLAADYRQYPSLPYLCLALSVALAILLQGRWRWVALGSLAFYFGVSSHFVMNPLWATEESLWEQSVRHGGTSMAHHNYAFSQMGTNPDLAEEHFRESIRLNPNSLFPQINLGLLLNRSGKTEEGMGHLRTAVELAPNWAMPHYWLGIELAKLDRPEEAAGETGRASDLDPRHHEWAYQAAYDAQRTGDFEGSLGYLERLHNRMDRYKLSLFLLGFALQQTGDRSGAVEAYREFLVDRPSYYQARFNLGYALMEEGHCAEAVPEFLTTLELKPDYDEVHLHLSRCYTEIGESGLAEEHLNSYESGRSQ